MTGAHGVGDDRVQQVVVAALCRAVLLARAAVATAAAALGLLTGDDPGRVVALLAVLAVTAAGQLAALTRWPSVATRPVPALAADALVLLAVLALGRGGLPYFGYAAGSAALAGVLLGATALPLWTAYLVQVLVVSRHVLGGPPAPAGTATALLAAPAAVLLAGAGAVLATRALVRQLRLSLDRVAAAQRTAASQERARLARELHDSVSKTLRGMSLAALALPGSLRRQPDLAHRLAGAISAAAAAADREARELLEGLRLDLPDEDFTRTVDRLCRAWSSRTGIVVRAHIGSGAAGLELPVPVRYELARIAHEALTNVARHAGGEPGSRLAHRVVHGRAPLGGAERARRRYGLRRAGGPRGPAGPRPPRPGRDGRTRPHRRRPAGGPHGTRRRHHRPGTGGRRLSATAVGERIEQNLQEPWK